MEIAVAIPAYNRADLLEVTLDSVLGQTLPPTEVFVYDDGSSDGTPAVLARQPPLVRWQSGPNLGPGLARAAAIAGTTAPWIALCDSDDLWHPEHLAGLAALHQRWPAVSLMFSNFETFGPGAGGTAPKFDTAPVGWWSRRIVERDGDACLLGEAPYPSLLSFQPIFPSTLLFRRAAYERVGGTRPEVSRWPSEDAHLTRRLLLVSTVACTWRSTCQIRRHAGNYSSLDLRNDEGRLRILELLRHDPLLGVDAVAATEREIARSVPLLFRGYFHAREYAAAARLAAAHPAMSLGWRRAAARLLGRGGAAVDSPIA